MPRKIKRPRQFEVHSRRHETVTARIVEELSLEAAAIAFIDDVGASLHGSDEHTITVYVRDLAGGMEHCMRIDLDTGKAQPCN